MDSANHFSAEVVRQVRRYSGKAAAIDAQDDADGNHKFIVAV